LKGEKGEMKIPVFVVGCVLALASAVGLGLCLVGAWFLQHPLPDLPDYNPPRARTTAVGLLIILLVVLLLGAVANLLVGIGAFGMGAYRGRRQT